MANHIQVFNRAMAWIRSNTINEKGICVTHKKRYVYPKATGGYIPSLLNWGEKERAIAFAKHLCSIQKEDGAWYDSEDRLPGIFGTGLILKGLIAIRELYPEANAHIAKGCDLLLRHMIPEGRLPAPDGIAWTSGECEETIHICCLSPLMDAARIFDNRIYAEAARKSLAYYTEHNRDSILGFGQISHFHACVMEALADMGETDLCREAMNNLERYRNKGGGIPAFKDVPWISATGCLQLAVTWYKLGELEKGDRLFNYTIGFQNPSGGWFGSYPESKLRNLFRSGRMKPGCFPAEEISWANKFFLDALTLKLRLEFERSAKTFHHTIDRRDGRYQSILQQAERIKAGRGARICDIGCGPGRYLKNLLEDYPDNDYYGVDLSESVLAELDKRVTAKQGSLTNVPYKDEFFDMVYTCEALEHAVNISGAVRELWRITKPGGRVVVIDKPVEKLGRLEIDPWEQWFSDSFFYRMAETLGGELEIVKSVPYESYDDGLFRVWILKKKKRIFDKTV